MADTEIDGQLSETAKTLIRAYIVKLVVPSAIALSIISAIAGFAINEVARGDAYVKAYGEASKSIIDTATAASKAVGQAETLRDVSKKSSDDAESALKSVLNSKLQLEQLLNSDTNAIASALVTRPDFKSALANVSQDELKQLNGQIASLRETVLTMQNVSSNAIVNGTDPSVAGQKGSVDGLAGTYSLDNYSLDNDRFVACPPGSFVSGIQGFKPNGQASIVQIRYACRSLR